MGGRRRRLPAARCAPEASHAPDRSHASNANGCDSNTIASAIGVPLVSSRFAQLSQGGPNPSEISAFAVTVYKPSECGYGCVGMRGIVLPARLGARAALGAMARCG